MSKLEDEVLEKFSAALSDDETVPAEFAERIVSELSTPGGGNPEKLAAAFRLASGGSSE